MSDHPIPPRPEAVQHQVRFRLERLKQQAFSELAALPSWSSEEVRFGDSIASVTTYQEPEADGRLRIVVQYMPQGMGEQLIWRGVYAEGFWVTPEGEVTTLPDALRYGYM